MKHFPKDEFAYHLLNDMPLLFFSLFLSSALVTNSAMAVSDTLLSISRLGKAVSVEFLTDMQLHVPVMAMPSDEQAQEVQEVIMFL